MLDTILAVVLLGCIAAYVAVLVHATFRRRRRSPANPAIPDPPLPPLSQRLGMAVTINDQDRAYACEWYKNHRACCVLDYVSHLKFALNANDPRRVLAALPPEMAQVTAMLALTALGTASCDYGRMVEDAANA